MPIIIGQLIGALVMAMGSLVGRVLVALGLGFVSYLGFDALVSSITSQIHTYMSGFAQSTLAAWGGFFMLDVHVSMVLSAITVKIAMKALGDGKKVIKAV